jgi:hypothetical protein
MLFETDLKVCMLFFKLMNFVKQNFCGNMTLLDDELYMYNVL